MVRITTGASGLRNAINIVNDLWTRPAPASRRTCSTRKVGQQRNDAFDPPEHRTICKYLARINQPHGRAILLAPDEEQGEVMAETLRHLGHVFLEESGAIEGEPGSMH